MDVFGILRMFFDPAMGSHIAHAVEMCSVLNGDGRSSDISNQHALFQNLDFFRGGNSSVDFSAGQQSSCRNNTFDDRKFPDNQGAGRMNLAFELSVYADGSVEIDDSFEFNPFP